MACTFMLVMKTKNYNFVDFSAAALPSADVYFFITGTETADRGQVKSTIPSSTIATLRDTPHSSVRRYSSAAGSEGKIHGNNEGIVIVEYIIYTL